VSDRAIGLLISIASILISIAISYYFYRKSKERIDPCCMLQNSSMLGESSSAMRDVTLLYKGREIANLNRCLFTLWNKGSRTLLRSAVVDSDPIRIALPDGAKVLDVGLVKISRPTIGLNASIDKSEHAILIDFDFLDQGDGGIVEILYQGNETLAPFVTGSIMGAPKGLRRPDILRGLEYTPDDADENPRKARKEWGMPLVILLAFIAFTVTSAVIFGPNSPLSVIFMTLSGLMMFVTLAIALAGAYIYLSIRRAVGVPGILDDSWQSPTDDRRASNSTGETGETHN
jgi:hypothetical protein